MTDKPVMADPMQEHLRQKIIHELDGLDRDEIMREWRSWMSYPTPNLQLSPAQYETHPWAFPMQKAVVGARLGKVRRCQG